MRQVLLAQRVIDSIPGDPSAHSGGQEVRGIVAQASARCNSSRCKYLRSFRG